ncbi:MAG TPA: MBL fold metallo-hydrolase [Acidimicrobiia bacterium]|jgi:glyoxylase-like metal-dependent hydrolase (beta-lactamase superfamily II)/ferredoxin|nr:MBL fold metallo-hydrolase [Acidimicrobiia bacterium]
MARPDLRHPKNTDGDWFVDTRCIDCGTCRDIAPGLFCAVGNHSVVRRQPETGSGGETTDAWLAAQACPTNSIGTLSRQRRPGRLYPREIEAGSGVFDLGYCSEDSFGASAWFVQRPGPGGGNLLIDSPRFTAAVVGPIGEMGGIAHILLTHQDDVADAGRFAERFGARVWIHEDDRRAAPFATDLLRSIDEVPIAPGLVAVPVPGHTRGSVVYVLDDRFLFTGDSLAWSHERRDLTAFRGACWYSWTAQTRSLERLAASDHRFAWVLPGHGARAQADPDDFHRRLEGLVRRMGQPAG